MIGLSKYRKISQLLIISGLLTSCSVMDFYQSDIIKVSPEQSEPLKASEASKVLENGWVYRENILVSSDDSGLLVDLGLEQVTLVASCQLQPEAKQWLDTAERGLLLPVMEFAADFTFAPDLGKSARLYKTLDQHIRLSSASDSLRFYNTLLSSIEHNCPKNMNREMDSCQFRKWMSFTGFSDNDRVYDSSRIERWLKKHADVDYLIMATAELYNAKAMLNSRYSARSRVLTDKKLRVREKTVRPFLGKVRYDWVQFNESSEPLFKSYGFCEIHWPQSQSLRTVNGRDWQTVAQFESIADFMFPHFINFMDNAGREMQLR
ncbi:hypothetical protein [Endozoicomonas sp. OPT23]|uniref:hypothetical protein n=1 Tax=Endozoicomonas sp. OPT23 TaxID=2072845 RepID=UPI00129B5659|nr:hypothetical protein [Endozoicomonas sp. OPT23]